MRRPQLSVLLAAFAAGLLPAAAAPAAAGPVLVSAAPNAVAVTIYRDPERTADRDGPRRRQITPGAFALIAETRTIDLPPGVVTVRFEGVAGGIVPQSAILFGTDPRERNRDAALLSQKGLVDAFTGQQVTLRRTDPATGQRTEERATVLSAADRLVIRTARGAEAVYCSGLAQTLLYPGAPATLSAKPVLTMTTRDQPGGRAKVTLAYLATGFDWDATYVGTLAPDGRSLGLFAWLTMVSADETSFVDATTAAVAGRVNRSDETRDDTGAAARREAEGLDVRANCWPAGTTSDGLDPPPISPPMVMSMPAPMPMEMAADIVVTAQRKAAGPNNVALAVTAVSESLGDLKLYRIPVPVTVAAHSQKQVAFLDKPAIRGDLLYRAVVTGGQPEDPRMVYRFLNRKADGLGEPFPAGKVALYQDGPHGRQLVGETAIADKTTGEEVELEFGEASGVTLAWDETPLKRGARYAVTLRNANPFPAAVELEFRGGVETRVSGLPGALVRTPGKLRWRTVLPPGGERRIAYAVRDED